MDLGLVALSSSSKRHLIIPCRDRPYDSYAPAGDRYAPADRHPSDRDRYYPGDRDRYYPGDRERDRYAPPSSASVSGDRYYPGERDRYAPPPAPPAGDRYYAGDRDRYAAGAPSRDRGYDDRYIDGPAADRYLPSARYHDAPAVYDRYPGARDSYEHGAYARGVVEPRNEDRYMPNDRYGGGRGQSPPPSSRASELNDRFVYVVLNRFCFNKK